MAKDITLKGWQLLAIVGGSFLGGAMLSGGTKTQKRQQVGVQGRARLNSKNASKVDKGAAEDLHEARALFMTQKNAIQAEVDQIIASKAENPNLLGVSQKMVGLMKHAKNVGEMSDDYVKLGASADTINAFGELIAEINEFLLSTEAHTTSHFGDRVEVGSPMPQAS